MYLSVLPEGRDLPKELLGSTKYLDASSSTLPPQWVIARGRVLRTKRRRIAAGEDEERPLTPGRQLVLFFKIGSNWLDLAWVLFDGLQGDADTVRMIKDVQLKNTAGLTDQASGILEIICRFDFCLLFRVTFRNWSVYCIFLFHLELSHFLPHMLILHVFLILALHLYFEE